jgi:hypothetical protein
MESRVADDVAIHLGRQHTVYHLRSREWVLLIRLSVRLIMAIRFVDVARNCLGHPG